MYAFCTCVSHCQWGTQCNKAHYSLMRHICWSYPVSCPTDAACKLLQHPVLALCVWWEKHFAALQPVHQASWWSASHSWYTVSSVSSQRIYLTGFVRTSYVNLTGSKVYNPTSLKSRSSWDCIFHSMTSRAPISVASPLLHIVTNLHSSTPAPLPVTFTQSRFPYSTTYGGCQFAMTAKRHVSH